MPSSRNAMAAVVGTTSHCMSDHIAQGMALSHTNINLQPSTTAAVCRTTSSTPKTECNNWSSWETQMNQLPAPCLADSNALSVSASVPHKVAFAFNVAAILCVQHTLCCPDLKKQPLVMVHCDGHPTPKLPLSSGTLALPLTVTYYMHYLASPSKQAHMLLMSAVAQ